MRGMRREVAPQRRIEDLPDWALTPAQLNQRYKRMPVHDPFGTHPGEAEILTEILPSPPASPRLEDRASAERAQGAGAGQAVVRDERETDH